VPHAHPQVIAAPETLTAALARYLKARVRDLRVLASGWETTLFEFALGDPSERLPGVAPGIPLVLRFYQNVEAAGKGALEYRVISHLGAQAFPVPRAYLFESGGEAIGAPFLVMERLSGGPLFAIKTFPRAFKTFSMGFAGFVRAQARLHRMPVAPSTMNALSMAPDAQAGVAHKPGEAAEGAAARLLENRIETIASRIEQGPLPGLAAALEYLRTRASGFRESPASLLHLDYHPQNVLVEGLHVRGVIDWANAALGDRHFDAAMTATILSTSAMEHPRWMRDNLAGNNLRCTFNALYVAMYHAIAPMNLRRLRFYQGVAGALRLSMLGMMRVRGPQSVGFRDGAIAEVTPSVLRLLSAYVSRKTGVPVSIP
jgi:aminoglycoside phosphotransferase (APT) family kinase protein